MKVEAIQGSAESFSGYISIGGDIQFEIIVTHDRHQASVVELFPETDHPHSMYLHTAHRLSDAEVEAFVIQAIGLLWAKRPLTWRERRRLRLPEIS